MIDGLIGGVLEAVADIGIDLRLSMFLAGLRGPVLFDGVLMGFVSHPWWAPGVRLRFIALPPEALCVVSSNAFCSSVIL